MYRYEEKLRRFLKEHRQELVDLMITICQIPAPSNHEEKRAAFCKEWLEKQGAKNVTIDKALNVVYPINCEGSDEIVAVMAHSDTVFPDMEPMPLRIEDGKIFLEKKTDKKQFEKIPWEDVVYQVETAKSAQK